jgi:hypothetical protein
MDASLPTRIKECFSAMETSQLTFHQNVQSYVIRWEGYAYPACFWILREYCFIMTMPDPIHNE